MLYYIIQYIIWLLTVLPGNDTDTATIWINLDDANDSPRFNQLTYNGSVGENQEPAVYILTVSATDSDQQANNRKFSYALEDDFGQFSIDSENGRISTTRESDYNII